MRSYLLLGQILVLSFFSMGAKPHIISNFALKNNDLNFLELKLKKELSDKKLSPQKKYILTILAARELHHLEYYDKSFEFYLMARGITNDENKIEINHALTKTPFPKIFFYDVNLKFLITHKLYEKAILSINSKRLNEPENVQYRIVYDLLSVKIKKRNIKNLYCFSEYQKNPDDYQYSNLLCDLLIDYLHNGKLGSDHIKVVEEYFLKHDLKERYLLQIAKDLKNSQ